MLHCSVLEVVVYCVAQLYSIVMLNLLDVIYCTVFYCSVWRYQCIVSLSLKVSVNYFGSSILYCSKVWYYEVFLETK